MNEDNRLVVNDDGEALPAAVAALLSRSRAVHDLRHAARFLAGAPYLIANWLEQLSERSAKEIAGRSYWHPNGFAKLIVYVDPEFRIRLHVWPADNHDLAGESNPHSHRWDFASTVVAGAGLHMVEYAETDRGGASHDRYRYGADPLDPAALVHDGQARLVKTGVQHAHTGSVYSCDISVLHTVRPMAAGLTATMVVQGPHRTPVTRVYCPPGTSADQPNRAMHVEDFRLLVKSVTAELRAR